MKIINQSILKNLHLYFFYLFLFSVPFQTRKVFLTEYSFYSGAFTEWTTVFLYASDIFLILALVFWIIAIQKNSQFKNIISSPFVIPAKAEIYYYNRIKLFSQTFVSNLTFPIFRWIPDKLLLCRSLSPEPACLAAGKDCDEKAQNSLEFSSEKLQWSKNKEALNYYKNHILSNKWLFLFVFFVWLILNLAINKEYFIISAFQVAKFIELSLLIIFVYFNLSHRNLDIFADQKQANDCSSSESEIICPNKSNLQNSKVLVNSLFILAFSGFLQSLIAIYQFIAQHSAFSSLVLAKITGESIIGPQIPGVAKILVGGDKIIRAYGTFPHPNALGGFLVFTILITVYLYLEHRKYNLSSTKPNLTTRNSNVFVKEPLKNPTSVIPAKARIQDLTQKVSFKNVILAVFQTILNIKQYLRRLPSNALYMNIIESNSFYNTKDNKSQAYINSLFWTFILSIQLVGLFFTFSRSAWLGFLLSLFIISAVYFYNYTIVSHETIVKFQYNKNNKVLNTEIERNISNNNTFFNKLLTSFQHNFYIKSIIRYKELFIALMIIVFVIGINLPLASSRLDIDLYNENFISDNSAINERIFYNNVSRETISNNFIFGSGVGTFIFQIDNYLQVNGINQKLQPWQYQPAHNIYFLIASEIGIVGLILFLLLVISILYNSLTINKNIVSRETISSNYFFPNDDLNKNSSIIKKNQRNSPFERGGGVFKKLQNYCLIIKNKIISPIKQTEDSMNYALSHHSPCLLDKQVIEKDRDKAKIVSRETFDNNLNIYFVAILVAFLFIGLFDHYFWTLQQGRLMFWLVLGLMLSVPDYKK